MRGILSLPNGLMGPSHMAVVTLADASVGVALVSGDQEVWEKQGALVKAGMSRRGMDFSPLPVVVLH